jgi:hypothetical protein
LFSTPPAFVTLNGMRTPTPKPLFALFLLHILAGVPMLGCEGVADRDEARPKDKTFVKDKAPESKKVLIAKNIFLEVLPDKKRRVLLSGEICLREGQLELFLCRKQTKEHEAIVTADVDARKVHEALILAGAKEGSPVQFAPKYRPATGTKIKVFVQYKKKDKQVTVPAQSLIKDMKTGKALDSDWVFAGSKLVNNPLDPDKKHYLANDGDVICVSNFDTALLDLPIKSPKENADRFFTAFTEHIPPLETKVAVILAPVVEDKKDKK